MIKIKKLDKLYRLFQVLGILMKKILYCCCLDKKKKWS